MGYYIYKFFDVNDNLLYVGKTTNLKTRFKQHRLDKKWFYEVEKVMYAECNTQSDMSIYELYYINTLNPKYNIASVCNQPVTFKLNDLIFHRFTNFKRRIYPNNKQYKIRSNICKRDFNFEQSEYSEWYNKEYSNFHIIFKDKLKMYKYIEDLIQIKGFPVYILINYSNKKIYDLDEIKNIILNKSSKIYPYISGYILYINKNDEYNIYLNVINLYEEMDALIDIEFLQTLYWQTQEKIFKVIRK